MSFGSDELARSPFYATRRAAELTRREELVADQVAHPPLGTRRPADAPGPVRVGVTGTGADVLVLAWSAAELARERAAGARVLRRVGVRAGMRVANTLPGALATPGSLLLGDVVEELGGLDVPLGAGDARQGWELFDRVHPDVIVLDDDPAFLAAAPPADRPWWRGIVWLRAGSHGPAQPIPASAGFTGWQRTWIAVAEATSFVGGSCSAGRVHLDEQLRAEVVDARTGATLPAGRPGALVLTPLGLDAPLARYLTPLEARVGAEPCACGEAGVTLEPS